MHRASPTGHARSTTGSRAYRRNVPTTRTKPAVRDAAYAPMLATLGTPPQGTGRAVEVKADGQRGTIVVADGAVTVFSRNGTDITSLGVDVLVNGICPCHGPESRFARRHTCRAPSGQDGILVAGLAPRSSIAVAGQASVCNHSGLTAASINPALTS